ncbi:MAG TPA: hypothetical protein VH639_03200 [Bryobacteraceae bacterium]|jgi:hypothetical protein
MIAEILTFAACLGSGWFLARALTAGAFKGPRWSSLVVELAAGVVFGPGLASVIYFALAVAGAATRAGVVAATAAQLVVCAGIWWRLTPGMKPSPSSSKTPAWTWALYICAGAALILFLLDFQAATSANPNGDWDAMAVWNVRARFLASGDLWRRAVSPQMGGGMAGAAHPGYPLFLSAFLALQWTAAGGFDSIVPMAASLLFALAALGLLGAGVAVRKSALLGLLASLILLASDVFVSQAAAQYSDLLQGLAFLGALVLLESADVTPSPRLFAAIGLTAGLSAWIKTRDSYSRPQRSPSRCGAFVLGARFGWRSEPRPACSLPLP